MQLRLPSLKPLWLEMGVGWESEAEIHLCWSARLVRPLQLPQRFSPLWRQLQSRPPPASLRSWILGFKSPLEILDFLQLAFCRLLPLEGLSWLEKEHVLYLHIAGPGKCWLGPELAEILLAELVEAIDAWLMGKAVDLQQPWPQCLFSNRLPSLFHLYKWQLALLAQRFPWKGEDG